ncbi:MAG: DPP IV N-terminal domain-containing protein, partial [Bacteroidota bacterium]|nr:DPP IV N-terminal domain-containing protein [Bacteroidota bacterium]
MKSFTRAFAILLNAIFIVQLSPAQDKVLSIEDAVIGMWREYRPEHRRNIQWRPGSHDFTYIIGEKLLSETVQSDEAAKIMTLEQLGTAIMASNIEAPKRFPSVTWQNKGQFSFQSSDHWLLYDLEKDSIISNIQFPENSENYDIRADKRRMAFTSGNNVFITDDKGEVTSISNDRNLDIIYGQSVARREFGIEKGTFWSPDGEKLAYYVKDESNVSDYPLIDITTRVASVENIKYPMAGMKSEETTVRVYDVASGEDIQLQTEGDKEQYLTNIAWTPDNKYILIAVLNRGQDYMQLNIYDAKNGKFKKTLFEETHDKYTEPLHPAQFLPGKNDEFIWQSRRDGFNHLYLYTLKGKLLKQITSGDWLVTDVLGFDDNGDHVFIQATKESPLERHIYKVNIASGAMTKLTSEPGTHSATLSGDNNYVLDEYSSTEVPQAYDIINTDGTYERNVLTAKNPLEEVKPVDMEIGTIKAADGETDLYYRLIKPTDFDPSQTYPTVVYVYGGPHVQMITESWMGGARGWQYYMAQHGYVMFTLDNRGSYNRGLEFENIVHRQLGKHETADQMEGIKFLQSLPYVDTSRIGVHGWSFGGFMTTKLMLDHPDVFKVGVAGGPVTDWKYYEIMYGERYMDTPEENPEGYKNACLNDKVENLQGKLMMIHGGIDPVVVQQHSLVFVRECIKAGIPVDYFEYPQAEHNVGGYDRVHLMQKVSDY